jgi:hypothetical protein
MINWIDFGPHMTRIIDFIEFNNFVIIFLFNYTIKIDVHKIEHRPKNRYLFKIITIYFPTNQILNDKIKK